MAKSHTHRQVANSLFELVFRSDRLKNCAKSGVSKKSFRLQLVQIADLWVNSTVEEVIVRVMLQTHDDILDNIGY